MPTLDDVYRLYGEAAEAAQLLETELGNMLLRFRIEDECLVENKNPVRARYVFDCVNRHTLGQLLKGLNNHTQSLDELSDILSKALEERNRLFHSFYRTHNFRRNTEDGRVLMLKDLHGIHTSLLNAYKAVMRLDGFDLDSVVEYEAPTRHLKI